MKCTPAAAGAAWSWIAPTTTAPTDRKPDSRSTRDRRLFWLISAAWLMNIFDLALTLMAHQHNFLIELNPLAALVLPYGAGGLVAYKFVMLSIGTAIFWLFRHVPLTEKCAWFYAGVCVALTFWWQVIYRDIAPHWVQLSQYTAGLPA